jgi:hypothetical protein
MPLLTGLGLEPPYKYAVFDPSGFTITCPTLEMERNFYSADHQLKNQTFNHSKTRTTLSGEYNGRTETGRFRGE